MNKRWLLLLFRESLLGAVWCCCSFFIPPLFLLVLLFKLKLNILNEQQVKAEPLSFRNTCIRGDFTVFLAAHITNIPLFLFFSSCCQCVCMFFNFALANQSGVFVFNNHLNVCFYINRGQMSCLWLFLPLCLLCFYDSVIFFKQPSLIQSTARLGQ